MVTQKDQVVTGETAIFDTRANLITMAGGVVLTQCKNVLKGDRLKVDMTTGVSRVESDSNKVQGMFMQGQDCGSGIGRVEAGSGSHTVADPRQKIRQINALKNIWGALRLKPVARACIYWAGRTAGCFAGQGTSIHSWFAGEAIRRRTRRGITVKGVSEAGWWIYSACSVDAPRNAGAPDLRVRATTSPHSAIPSATC